jgi:hypothetical protein
LQWLYYPTRSLAVLGEGCQGVLFIQGAFLLKSVASPWFLPTTDH